MTYFIKIMYTLLFPPGIYIVALVILSGFFFATRKYRLASVIFIVSLAFYFSSCSFVGYSLMHRIENQYSFPTEISGDCILVLGEGASMEVTTLDGKGELTGDTALNVITALKLYNRLHIPILLSGGTGIGGIDAGNEAQLSKRNLLEMGIPEHMIILEDQSRTTFENAKYSADIVREKHFKKPILITTSPHMPRSVELFRQNGIEVLPLPTRYSPTQEIHYNVFDFLPSSTGTSMVQQGLKETIGKLQKYLM